MREGGCEANLVGILTLAPLIPAQAGIQQLGPRFRGDETESVSNPRKNTGCISGLVPMPG